MIPKVKTVPPSGPDVVLTIDWQTASALRTMLLAAESDDYEALGLHDEADQLRLDQVAEALHDAAMSVTPPSTYRKERKTHVE
jgi:hypothetical protein